MAYVHSQTVNGTFITTTVTNRAATFAGSVAVGDLITVCTTYEDPGSFTDIISDPTNGNNKDSLGNTYTLAKRVTNATGTQGLAYYYSVVTVSGTPTITQRYNPTPGTTTQANVGFVADHYTGTTAGSALDGANGQAQNSPGTGTDALTSTAFATATDGDIILGASLDLATNNAITAGTGFSNAGFQDGGAGNLLWRTFFMTQTTHSASTVATATAGTGTDIFVTLGFAITPSAPSTLAGPMFTGS